MIWFIISVFLATIVSFFTGLFVGVGIMIKHLIADKRPILWSGKNYRIYEEVLK